ncbi:MAG: hypothetical protein PHH06_04745 [Candidatus Gracilibacteria bacterium]|nr:hypothetical protein [Candidatus Gracilibacteria bacterium]
MIKKILVSVFLFFIFISSVYGLTEEIIEGQREQISEMEASGNTDNDTYRGLVESVRDYEADVAIKQVETENQQIYDRSDELLREQEREAREAACAISGDCIDQPTFMIKTNDFVPGGKSIKTGSTAKENINNALSTIIQKLMVALGVLSLFIMTVGAGYIIMYHGQDELLSKGKSIFMSGIIALVVALTSYYLVSLLRYILYVGS